MTPLVDLPPHVNRGAFIFSAVDSNTSIEQEMSPPNTQVHSKEEAQHRDAQDPLGSLREEFIIPSKQDLQRKTLAVNGGRYTTDFN